MEIVGFSKIFLIIPIIQVFTGGVVFQFSPVSIVNILTLASIKIRIIYILSFILCKNIVSLMQRHHAEISCCFSFFVKQLSLWVFFTPVLAFRINSWTTSSNDSRSSFSKMGEERQMLPLSILCPAGTGLE